MNLYEFSEIAADEQRAFDLLESTIWPHGPVCPHCEHEVGEKPWPIYDLRKTRPGLRKCSKCRKQFTARIGTIFEDSHIPLGKWLIAIHMMCSSKKGVSAAQLQRQLGLSYKSSWFMCHRIRFAMTQPPLVGKLGGPGTSGIVEIDETYIGGKRRNNPHRNYKPRPKAAVMTLIERDGNARTFPIPGAKSGVLTYLAVRNVEGTAKVITDSHRSYGGLVMHFEEHGVVDHSKEYVRGILHTNFAESYHSLLKRGIVGTFHHISEKHLPRYLREFEFRWNSRKVSDGERVQNAIRGARGKRLMYRAPISARRGASSLDLA